ncbi:hypothetical protein [Devosia sp.]|uniref:hypothetical protein n=1 Tax=Devosia sp. TaxID=1871048 RepID=UPI0035AD9911
MARDRITLDLFRDFEPPEVVARFPAEQVRAETLAGKLSRAVKATLDAFAKSRGDTALAMTEFLGEDCSKTMLDKYASQGAEHSISAARLAALVAVTGDPRPLNALLESIGLIVVPKRYEWLIRRERARELQRLAEQEAAAADAQWRAQR